MGILDQKQLPDWDRFQRAVFLSGSYTWKLKLIVSWKTNGLAWTHNASGQAFNKCMPAYKSPILAWQIHPLVTETSADWLEMFWLRAGQMRKRLEHNQANHRIKHLVFGDQLLHPDSTLLCKELCWIRWSDSWYSQSALHLTASLKDLRICQTEI